MDTKAKHIELGQKGEQLSVELMEKKGFKYFTAIGKWAIWKWISLRLTKTKSLLLR